MWRFGVFNCFCFGLLVGGWGVKSGVEGRVYLDSLM